MLQQSAEPFKESVGEFKKILDAIWEFVELLAETAGKLTRKLIDGDERRRILTALFDGFEKGFDEFIASIQEKDTIIPLVLNFLLPGVGDTLPAKPTNEDILWAVLDRAGLSLEAIWGIVLRNQTVQKNISLALRITDLLDTGLSSFLDESPEKLFDTVASDVADGLKAQILNQVPQAIVNLLAGFPILKLLKGALAFVRNLKNLTDAWKPLVEGVNQVVDGDSSQFAGKVKQTLLASVTVLAKMILNFLKIDIPGSFQKVLASVNTKITGLINNAIDAALKKLSSQLGGGKTVGEKDFSYKNVKHKVWLEDDGKGKLRLRIASDNGVIGNVELKNLQDAYDAYQAALKAQESLPPPKAPPAKSGQNSPAADKKAANPVDVAYQAYKQLRDEILAKFKDGAVPKEARVFLLEEEPGTGGKLSKESEPIEQFLEGKGGCQAAGATQILVHNASAPKYGPTMSLPFTGSDNMMHTATVGTWAETTLDASNVGGMRVNLTEPAWWKFLTTAVAGAPVQQGHILASTLGGTEKGPTNFTPLYMKPNTPAMSTCERFLRDLIKEMQLLFCDVKGNRKWLWRKCSCAVACGS